MNLIRLALCCAIALCAAYWWRYRHWWLLIGPVYGVIALAMVDLAEHGRRR